VIRHFTASAVILRDDHVLLIWKPAVGWWLQPGGHVEPDEDPVQAMRREIREEVGLEVDILGRPPFEHPAVGTVAPPFTIMVEDVTDRTVGPHQHIDMIYVCRPRPGATVDDGAEYAGAQQARWVPIDDVADLDTAPELPDLVAAAHAWTTGSDAHVLSALSGDERP
jgi:8-oxo-dGTP diphosphatase